MKAEKIIRLRMQNSIFCRRIPVVQGDTARTFRFILEDITLDGTEHARIYARKPSGAEVYDECEVVGSNEVIFTPETEQIFIETGIILAEIRVAKGEKLITSYSFEFEVRQSTMRTGDIPSSDEFNALERAIEEAKGLHEPEFTEAGKRENIVSGETMQILFGKIKKWFTDLGALITKIGNKDISSIGDGTVTGAITDLDKRSTKNTSDIDVERKRIDNIAKLPEGATTGDAELTDIRVAADGTSYDTAGEAVRGQINQIDQKYEKETSSLKEDLIDLTEIAIDGEILSFKKANGNLYVDMKRNKILGTIKDICKIAYCKCSKNTTYIVEKSKSNVFKVCYSTDIPKKDVLVRGSIESVDSTEIKITTDDNAQYLIVYYAYNDIDENTIFESIKSYSYACCAKDEKSRELATDILNNIYSSPNLELGTLNLGKEENSLARVRSGKIFLKQGCCIYVKEPYNFWVSHYDKNGDFIKTDYMTDGFVTQYWNLSDEIDCIRVVIKDTTTDNIDLNAIKLYIKSNEEYFLDDVKYEKGNIEDSTGLKRDAPERSRIRTSEFITPKKNMIVKCRYYGIRMGFLNYY